MDLQNGKRTGHEPADTQVLADVERRWREAVETVYTALSANPSADINLFKLFSDEGDARQHYADALREAGRPVPDHLRVLAPLSMDWLTQPTRSSYL
jgi:hypothetical protein